MELKLHVYLLLAVFTSKTFLKPATVEKEKSVKARSPAKLFRNKQEVMTAYEDYIYFNPNRVAITAEEAALFEPTHRASSMVKDSEHINYSETSQEYAKLLRDSLNTDHNKAKLRAKPNGKNGKGLAKGKSRRRRDVVYPQGTVTQIRSCLARGTTGHGTVQLATICFATTTLPVDRFPRYLNEFVCHGFDVFCLTGEGVATQEYTTVKLRKNPGNYSESELHLWEEYDQEVKNGCSCRVFEGSLFQPFV